MRRSFAIALAIGVLLISVKPQADAQPPIVKKLGNAIVEYRDAAVQAVIAYEYSHRFHDGAWLLIETAVRTTDDMTFHRRDFTLVTANETTVPLATEERYVEDGARIRQIHQNAGIWSRSLTSYFDDRHSRPGFLFFALPGEGVVTDSIVTYRLGPTSVTLYFVSPEGRWREGTYHLTIDNGRARAVLPIELK
jgi:hypothetical protein